MKRNPGSRGVSCGIIALNELLLQQYFQQLLSKFFGSCTAGLLWRPCPIALRAPWHRIRTNKLFNVGCPTLVMKYGFASWTEVAVVRDDAILLETFVTQRAVNLILINKGTAQRRHFAYHVRC